MSIKKIALIGFGEVGVTLAADIAERNNVALSAFDLRFDTPDSPPSIAIATAGVEPAASASACVKNADLVISAVTAASTLDVARSIVDGLKAGAWYFDINSAAPASKEEAAAEIEAEGGRYIEASIMSPIHPKRIAAPILLGGPHAHAFEAVARSLGFSSATFYSDQPGKAAAAKLCRSVVVKGMEALITESLLAAQHYGVEDDVIASLTNLFPHPDWRGHAQYMISRTLEHGTRRAEEMREAARTVADAGGDPWMANATVLRQAFAGSLGLDGASSDLATLLSFMRERMTTDEHKLEPAS